MRRLAGPAWSCLLLASLLATLGSHAARADEAPQADLSMPESIRKALASPDAAVRLAAAKAAADVQDPKLVAPLAGLLDDEEPIREAAVAALRARTAEKDRRAAALALASRLPPLEREPTPEQQAREQMFVPALHDLAQKATIARLLDDVHLEAPAAAIRARLRAVANVPAPEAIEALIDYGARRRAGDGHRAAVRDALRYATDIDLSGDPDRWRAWWREAKATFDFAAAAERRAEARQKEEERERRREERRDREEGGGTERGRGRPEGEAEGSG